MSAMMSESTSSLTPWPLPFILLPLTSPSSTEALVVVLQHGNDLGPAELGGNLLAFGKHFAQTRAGNLQAVLGPVRAGARRRHAIAFIAEKCDVDLEGLDGQ